MEQQVLFHPLIRCWILLLTHSNWSGLDSVCRATQQFYFNFPLLGSQRPSLTLNILVSVVNISISKSLPVGIEQKMATFWFEHPTVKICSYCQRRMESKALTSFRMCQNKALQHSPQNSMSCVAWCGIGCQELNNRQDYKNERKEKKTRMHCCRNRHNHGPWFTERRQWKQYQPSIQVVSCILTPSWVSFHSKTWNKQKQKQY